MLKFIRSKGHQQPTAERVKLQKELYAFRKVSQPRIISLVNKKLNYYINFVEIKISYQQNTKLHLSAKLNTQKSL